MLGMRGGVRQLCVAYDVEHYSGKGTGREIDTQERLAALVEFALGEAGLARDDYRIQEQGDGGLALLPTGGDIDEPWLLVRLIRGFETGLEELNAGLLPDWRMRVRVALHQGVVHRAAHGYAGPAVTEVFRILDSGVVRSALAGSAGFVVVAVADPLYRDVLMHGYHGLRGSAFSRVRVESKKFSADAWLYAPGAGLQEHAGPPSAGPGDDRPAASGGPAGPVHRQRNSASAGGVVIGAQGGSVHVGTQPGARKGTQMAIEAELPVLAATAAGALVTAMTTDSWQGVRDAVAGLFKRANPARHTVIDGRLDDNASLVSTAADPARARATVHDLWELEFAELLRADPGCAAELASIVRQYAGSTAAARLEQVNIARDSGTVFAAQLGDVHVHADVASAIVPVRKSPGNADAGQAGSLPN
jgi:hypothetical protein